jgi:DNA transposition AAA+ family ATPase
MDRERREEEEEEKKKREMYLFCGVKRIGTCTLAFLPSSNGVGKTATLLKRMKKTTHTHTHSYTHIQTRKKEEGRKRIENKKRNEFF